MIFLLNLLFAILAFLIVRYIMSEVGSERKIATIVALIVGIVVFILNLATQVI